MERTRKNHKDAQEAKLRADFTGCKPGESFLEGMMSPGFWFTCPILSYMGHSWRIYQSLWPLCLIPSVPHYWSAPPQEIHQSSGAQSCIGDCWFLHGVVNLSHSHTEGHTSCTWCAGARMFKEESICAVSCQGVIHLGIIMLAMEAIGIVYLTMTPLKMFSFLLPMQSVVLDPTKGDTFLDPREK